MVFFTLLSTLPPEDRGSAGKIFELYGKMVYEAAFKVLKNHHDAEDALDDVMVNVVKNFIRFKDKSEKDIIAQLVIYSRNAAINIYNKNKRRYQHESSLFYLNEDNELENIDIPDDSPTLDDIVFTNEMSAAVRFHVQRLPQPYRDVIVLVYGFGYSSVEAARVLTTTPNAVGIRIHKAKKKLLEIAGGELYEYIK